MCAFGMFRSGPQIMALLKYFKHIKPSRIQSVLPKPDCPLAHLMPSSAIETAKTSAVYEMKRSSVGRHLCMH